MTDQELHSKALTFIWGWASYLYEGIENGELSDHFNEEVCDGRMTEEEAKKCMEWCKHEAEIIWRKNNRLRNKKR